MDDILATSLMKYDLKAEVCGIYKMESGKHIAKVCRSDFLSQNRL